WHRVAANAAGGSFAFDLATRESPPEQARRAIAEAATLLDDCDIAYLKCDSLLRGAVAQDIAVCLATGLFGHCVIAPAFPAQRRVTRAGRQWAKSADDAPWQCIQHDLARELRRHGVAAEHRRPGEPAPTGASLWDAEHQDDLARIVAAGKAL